MKIIGIDPSLTNTGLVLLEGIQHNWKLSNLLLISTEANSENRRNYDDLERAKNLKNQIVTFISNADYVCVEIPQIGGANMQARSMWTSGIALGIIACIDANIIKLSPSDIKNVTGKKTSSKEEMCQWAYHNYPSPLWPSRMLKGLREPLKKNHHLADALAAAVAGLQKLDLY